MTIATALVTANTPDPQLAEEAVATALVASGIAHASAVLLFLTPEFARHAQAAVTAAARRAQCMQVTGGIAAGVFTESGWALDRPAAAVLVLGEGFSLKPCEHADSPLLGLARASPPSDWLAATPRFGAVFGDSFSANAAPETPSLWQQGRLSSAPCFSLQLSSAEMDIGLSTGLKLLGKPQRIEQGTGFEVETLGNQPATRHLIRALPPEMREAPARHLHHLSAILFDTLPVPGQTGRAVAVIDATNSQTVTIAERVHRGQYLAWAIRQPLAAEAEMRDTVAGLTVAKPDFALIGEVLFGDYNIIVNDEMLHSCTNYECYKGLYSSFNSMNMFEIAHSLHRQFGSDQWCIYRGKHLMTFVDNHDVTRLASILTNKKHIPLAYGLLMGMPGIPCLYYGSEWAEQGEKAPDNDYALRPCFEEPKPNELTEFIKKLIRVRQESDALCNGAYKNVVIQNHQLVFERCSEKERVIVAINAADYPYTANAGELNGTAADLLTGETVTMNGQLELKPYSVQYLKF